jgi:hypothetical protein
VNIFFRRRQIDDFSNLSSFFEGTVSQDFWPSIFFINQTHLTNRLKSFQIWLCISRVTVFASKVGKFGLRRVYNTRDNKIKSCEPPTLLLKTIIWHGRYRWASAYRKLVPALLFRHTPYQSGTTANCEALVRYLTDLGIFSFFLSGGRSKKCSPCYHPASQGHRWVWLMKKSCENL